MKPDPLKPTKVLLLEPDLWRYLGIFHTLQSKPEIELIGQMDYNKILALRKVQRDLKPDVVLLSHILLMDFNVSLLARIAELFPQTKILVHGYDARVNKIAEILRAGANGYFLLSSLPAELVEALALTHKGLMWAPPEAVALMVSQSRWGEVTKLMEHPEELLTAYEKTILKLLKQGMSNKEIANQFGVAEVTIKSHLGRLYKRFSVKTRLQLLSYAIDHNLIVIRKPDNDHFSERQ